MGKTSFTRDEIDAYRGRPAFTDQTKAVMEARWASQSGIYKPQLVTVHGEPQLHVICQACNCLGQAATMHIGHITNWKAHVKAAMTAAQESSISTSRLVALFNDHDNLRWEHAACNESHAFEKGNPFAEGLKPSTKVAMLKKVKFISEGKFSSKQIRLLTPEEFQYHANRKFVPSGEEGQPQSTDMTNGAQILTASLPPRIDNDIAKPIDLSTLKRKKLGWFDTTRKALFRLWNGQGLANESGTITYLKCGSCQKFTEGSSMHMGHKTVWKKHLESKGVTNLKDAKIAYNDLENLRFECSKCNTSHDWEDLTEEEQDALDNALYRVADLSGLDDESWLMRTLVFGELKNLPDDLVVDGELMRRVAVFANAEGAMHVLRGMAEELARELDAERQTADLRGHAIIEEALAFEAVLQAEAAEAHASKLLDDVRQERAAYTQEMQQAAAEAQAKIDQAKFTQAQYDPKTLTAEDISKLQTNVDYAEYHFEQARQYYSEQNHLIESHEHETAQAVQVAQNARQAADAQSQVAQHSIALFNQANTALLQLREANEAQREQRYSVMYGLAKKAEDDWDADEQYFMLRGVLNPGQRDGLKLLQAALRAEEEFPDENNQSRKERVLREVEQGLRYSSLDYKSPEFKNKNNRLALVENAFAYAHAKAAKLKRVPNTILTLDGQSVGLDLLYTNLVEIRETGKPSEEVKRIFMEKLNATTS